MGPAGEMGRLPCLSEMLWKTLHQVRMITVLKECRQASAASPGWERLGVSSKTSTPKRFGKKAALFG